MGIRRVSSVVVSMALALSLAACTKSATDTTEPSDTTVDDGSGVDFDAAQKVAADMVATCASGKPVTGRAVRIAVTVAPLTSLVASIAGDSDVEIVGIVPEGTNSHTYEPPTSAAASLSDADIIFANGLKLEDPTLELARKVAPDAIVCELGTAVLPENEWIYDFSFPKEGGKPNPHIWTNPPHVLQMLSVIRDAVTALDPTDVDTIDGNYVKASAVFMGLDEAMKKATETLGDDERKLLTYHDAYAYFAEHFGYQVIGAIQPSSFEEPSPKDVAALIDQVEARKVRAIFGSEVFPSPVLAQIGKATGARYVDSLRDDDLPGKPGEPEHSLAGLLRFNFASIVSALGGDAKAVESFAIATGVPDKAVYPQ